MATNLSENNPQTVTLAPLPALPPEVLQHILGDYDPSWDSVSVLRTWDLRSLCLVNKTWQLMAERELYRTIIVCCHEKLMTRGLREGKFGALERVGRALLLTEDGPRRRGYVREIRLRNLGRELFDAWIPSFKSSYLSLTKTILSSLPNLEHLVIAILPSAHDEPSFYDHFSDPAIKLLLSESPLDTISNLKACNISTDIVHNQSVSAFLNQNPRLRSVEITHMFGPRIACDIVCIGEHTTVALPDLTKLVAPATFFQHVSCHPPDTQLSSPSLSSVGINAPTLREAGITWQNLQLPIEPILASLDNSRESLRSLTCRRPGSNADLLEALAGRFKNLRLLKIDSFGGSHGAAGAPEDITKHNVKRAAVALATGFPALEDLHYNNYTFSCSCRLQGPSADRPSKCQCQTASRIILKEFQKVNLTPKRCSLFESEYKRGEDGKWRKLE